MNRLNDVWKQSNNGSRNLESIGCGMTQMTPELESIVENFVAAEQRLQETVARIPHGRWSDPSPNAGWTNKDLLAHLTTGDWICQHFLRELLKTGGVPEWPDADAGNAKRVAARRDKSVSELAVERAEHRNETVSLISQLQPEHLDAPIDMPWFNIRGASFVRYLQGFPGHDIDHIRELEASAEEAS
jgi:hypothetical protein